MPSIGFVLQNRGHIVQNRFSVLNALNIRQTGYGLVVYGVGFVIERSRVRLLAAALPGSDSRQGVHNFAMFLCHQAV